MRDLRMGEKVTYPGIDFNKDDYAVLCTDKFHLDGEDWYIMQIHKGHGEPHTFPSGPSGSRWYLPLWVP